MTALATYSNTSFRTASRGSVAASGHRSGRPAGVMVRPVAARPAPQIYIRRRVLAAVIALAIVLLVGLGAGTVVANRGAAPASGSSVRPAIATYVVHHGDTMWSIAASHHGQLSQSDYVDLLVQANGGASLQVGQQIVLP
jgi:LysM repeat protein